MEGLLFFHSLLRYIVLILIIASIFFAFKGYFSNAPILIGERKVWIFTVVSCHIQLVVGGALYWMNVGSYGTGRVANFFKYEHMAGMILAILLITLGRVFSKRARSEKKKQLLVGVFYLMGLLLILKMIPWPFVEVGHNRGWL